MSTIGLRGGTIVDGTGAPPARGDVLIDDERIVSLLPSGTVVADRVVDVSGHVVAPGFIDLHAHSDLSILGHPDGTSKVLQGVTTEVVGNCGLSVAPVSGAAVVDLLRPLMTYCDDPSVTWDWTGVDGYLARVNAANPLPRIEILAGHNTIRGSVLGMSDRVPDSGELRAMQDMLARAMGDGAVGMSVGLMYPPSGYADEAELIALGEVIARHDGLFASHMADYSAQLLDSVSSMIRVAEASGCRMQLSHLAVVGETNWGAVSRALELVDAAVARGVDVAADVYPYLAGSTNLSQFLPPAALADGFAALSATLRDPVERAALREHLANRSLGWHEVLLVFVPHRRDAEGHSIAALAERDGIDPSDLVLDLLALGDATIVAFGRSEDDLRAALRHPRVVMGSDGLAVDTAGVLGGPVPHPRFFGAFPALLGEYVRDKGVLPLEEAVRKCTSGPADRLGLADRGRLEPGLLADVVVFDAETIADRSTYTASRAVPSGIHSVYRGGELIAAAGAVVRA